MSTESKCPVTGGHAETAVGKNMGDEGKSPAGDVFEDNAVVLEMSNRTWWPNQLNLKVPPQHSSLSDPMAAAFNYAEEFKSLDLDAVRKDLNALMTDSQG